MPTALISLVLLAGAAARANEFFGFGFADSFGRFLKQQRRKLHRFDIGAAMLADLGCYLLEPFQGSRRKRNQPPLSPTWIRRSTAMRRYPEAGLRVRQQLHRSEVAPWGGDPSAPVRAEPFGDLLHVKLRLRRLLSKITNREIFVADALPALPPRFFATAPIYIDRSSALCNQMRTRDVRRL